MLPQPLIFVYYARPPYFFLHLSKDMQRATRCLDRSAVFRLYARKSILQAAYLHQHCCTAACMGFVTIGCLSSGPEDLHPSRRSA